MDWKDQSLNMAKEMAPLKYGDVTKIWEKLGDKDVAYGDLYGHLKRNGMGVAYAKKTKKKCMNDTTTKSTGTSFFVIGLNGGETVVTMPITKSRAMDILRNL